MDENNNVTPDAYEQQNEGITSSFSRTDTTYSTTDESVSTTPVTNGLAIASLICGILSIVLSCCCGNILFSIAGIVCGCLQKPDENGKKPGMATAGIITSIVGIVLLILLTIIGFSAFALSDT